MEILTKDLGKFGWDERSSGNAKEVGVEEPRRRTSTARTDAEVMGEKAVPQGEWDRQARE